MSFILDALKKSEIERQRQTVPGLMDTRLAPRRTGLPAWAVGLGLLLAINLLVLTFVLMKRSTVTATAAPAALNAPNAPNAANAASAANATAATRPNAIPAEGLGSAAHFSPLDAAPVYAPEIPVTPVARSAGEAPPPARAPKPQRRADPLLSDVEANAATEEVLPTISEISLGGAQALPELHLDVHVYATNPADRFVYINMRKYHEGTPLQEGPVVERIRRDGVVLNYQGLRFILPRQP
jgi:general secretion pathway protein B